MKLTPETERPKLNSPLLVALSVLPEGLREEIEALSARHRGVRTGISEIRIRLCGLCSLVAEGLNIPLAGRIGAEEMRQTVKRICKGSLYAHRESITKGYLPMSGGVRVGVAGTAKYEGGNLVGVSEVTSLVFRIPTGRCEFGEELIRMWRERGGTSMLIISPPGGGKTTALRRMAAILGGTREALRTVVVDERCEFLPEDYYGMSVDLVRGYARARGVEIALRTMSPQIILVDEIATGEDADAVRAAGGVGIPVIATAHGDGMPGIRTREFLLELVEGEGAVFSSVAAIRRTGGVFFSEILWTKEGK